MAEGDPLCEIETSKINTELESPAPGVLAHIVVAEGETVRVGSLLAVLGKPGEKVERPAATRPAAAARPQPAPAAQVAPARPQPGVQITPLARRLAQQRGVDLSIVRGSGPSGRIVKEDVERALEAPGSPPQVQVVPAARRLVSQRGIDLAQVQGSGPNGRILLEDVERGAAAKAGPPGKVTLLSGIRRTIAQRMRESVQSMAQVTLTTEADVTALVQMREELVELWRPHRLRPLHQDMVVMATARALKEHPRLNALMIDDEIRVLEEVNLGVAIAIPDGLLVPVIKRAGKKSLIELAQEVRDLVKKTGDNKLSPEDMADGGFTITNLGSYDIDAFTPIINPPEVGILGVGRVMEKPAVHQGKIAVRSMVALSLTFDHRALDGVPASEFLRAIKQYLEEPRWMLSP